MKIIYLIDNFPPEKYGGAASMGFNMAKNFKDPGNDVLVLTTVQDKLEAGEVFHGGVRVIKIYSNYNEKWRAYLSLYNPQTVSKIKTIFEKEKPDIVHAHNVHFYLSYYSLVLAKKYAKKVFLTVHDVMLVSYGKAYPINKNILPGEKIKYNISFLHQIKNYKWRFNPLRNICIQYFLSHVNKIFTVSYALKEVLENNGVNNITVVHNGIAVSEWQINDSLINSIRAKYKLAGKKIVFFAGRISNAKGGFNLIEAIKKIQTENRDVTLLIVGRKDNYIDNLIKKSVENDNVGGVVCTDWVEGDELKALYWSSSVVVVPSLCFDSFPNINLEAMASHKPIIGTCFGGSKEAIINGQTGFIINPNDTNSLANKIITLLGDPELAKDMGDAGFKRVKELFSLEKQTKDTLYWYNL